MFLKKLFMSCLMGVLFSATTNVDCSAIDRLLSNMEAKNSLVCVGLDPDLSKFPEEILNRSISTEEKTFAFLKEVIEITAPHCCSYKIQKAFFDPYEKGHELLKQTVGYIHQNYPKIPVFIDCKIGDTENTMKVYMQNIFEKIKADGVVINPYMGDDVFLPFLEDPEKIAIVLVQTSNPGGKCIQELDLANGKKLWQKTLELVIHRWNKNGNMIPVLSSNSTDVDFASVRNQIPQEMPILLAGVGSQGGDPTIMRQLLDKRGIGVFVNSSRGICYPYCQNDPNWREEILKSVLYLKKELNSIREEHHD